MRRFCRDSLLDDYDKELRCSGPVAFIITSFIVYICWRVDFPETTDFTKMTWWLLQPSYFHNNVFPGVYVLTSRLCSDLYFKTKHYTTTFLTTLTQHIYECLNAPKPAHCTPLATIELTKPFDTIPRTLIMQKTNKTNMSTHTTWSACSTFLQVDKSILSSTVHYPEGEASPLEFRKGRYSHRPISTFSCSTYLSQYIQTHTYSPTTMTLPSSSNSLTHKLPPPNYIKGYINTLELWLFWNRMKVFPSKSTNTLITLWAYTNTATILGVTYGKSMPFITHTNNLNTKAKTCLNVFRALTNTTFGESKEITLVYKQYTRPILRYAHQVWQPNTKAIHIQKQQIAKMCAHNRNRLHTDFPHPPSPQGNTSNISQATHAHEMVRTFTRQHIALLTP